MTRTELALAACEGLSDTELQNRGAGSFKAMITRKREYAQLSRMQFVVITKKDKRIKALEAALAAEKAKYQALVDEKIDTPIQDVQQAAQLLSSFTKGGATPPIQ